MLETKTRRLTRRSFLSLSAAALGGMALYSAEIARHELSVEEHSIHLARLPDAFRGLRIVLVSDFHYEDYTEPFFLREVVKRVNNLRPEMVLMPGDFITHFPGAHRLAGLTRMVDRQAVECAAILSEIECPLRYASLGNHDESMNPQSVIGALEGHGIRVLRNRAVPLERDGQRIWLAGTGSACEDDFAPDRAIPPASMRNNEAVILMAHEPDVLPDAARYNVDLMLSGHTHGGQVRLPFLPALVLPTYGKRYVEGLFHYGPTQLYVNRGIGTVGLPLRLNCPPEITVITLA
ncbi:MAG TPA: metallophosphoesterase [Acidobacteriaceae bacterium]|nr:metallophosphoesterase [Acidobacteriaceae bacterium]